MLELISVNKEYITKSGNTIALKNVNLCFPDTGLVFITGKSGSGKTTLLNIIGGLDTFDSGEILLNGKSFSNFTSLDFDSYRNTYVGFIFQEYNLVPEYSIKKNIQIALELQGKDASEKEISEILESVELSGVEERKPNQLSGGQKQRVAIVRALIKNPKIILADELTGALDSSTSKQVLDIIKKLSKDKLVIVVSHDLEFAEKYADRIIKISDGEVVEDIVLTDVELKGNLYQTSNQLTVKIPSELNDDESKILVKAIKEDKNINFTKKISIREKTNTLQPKTEKEENLNLINSKMKFVSAMGLGFKSIWTKPLRLMFTILLSVLAFSVFGLFDSIASFNNAKVVAELLRDEVYPSVQIYANYTDDYYEGTSLKISQKEIDELSNDTKYEFRGVYDINDVDIVKSSSREGMNSSIKILGFSQSNYQSYYQNLVNGLITFKNSEIDENVIDLEGFNFKILHGVFPEFNINDEIASVGISSYLAESIKWFVLNSSSTHQYNGKTINSIGDLVGCEIILEGGYNFIISCIIDCGELPEKYNRLLSKTDKTLENDFVSYLYSGCFLNLFVPEGYVEHFRSINNRVTNYYADYSGAEFSINIEDRKQFFPGVFYDFSEIPDTKYVFFDNSQKSLNHNEVLINIHDLFEEYIYMEKSSAFYNEYKTKIDDIKYQLLNNVNYNEFEIKISEFLGIIKKIQELDENIAEGTSKTISLIGKKRDEIKEIVNSSLKVVGVYYNINPDTYTFYSSKFNPIVVSREGLSNLNIFTGQGYYSRVIAPINSNYFGAKTLGNKMDVDVGLNYIWFGNSIFETIGQEKELIKQALDLCLYIAIIIVLFSIFMLFNYISLSISSKRQTIGVLRTLGANKKNIFAMFMSEALFIAILCSSIACLVSFISCSLVNIYLLDVMNLTFKIALFSFRQIVVIILGGLITGVLASLLPIIKISKKKPIELIKTI